MISEQKKSVPKETELKLASVLLILLLHLPDPIQAQTPTPSGTDSGPASIAPVSIQQLPTERIRLRSLIAEGRSIIALPYLEAYLVQYPENPALLLLKGEACFALERYQLAVDSFSRGVEKEPKKLGELFNYGRALQNLGQHGEAIRVFRAMQSRKETALRVRGIFGEGLSLQSQNQLQEARHKFEEVLKIDDQFDRARYRLAQLLLGEDPRLALDLLDQVLLRDPLQHGAAYNRALALRNLKKPEEARAAMARYQKILSGRSRIALLKERWALNPQDGSILLELGRVHRELSVYGESLRWFARAGAAMPNASEPPLETVSTLLQAGRMTEAEQLVQRLGETAIAQEAKKLLESFRAGSRKK